MKIKLKDSVTVEEFNKHTFGDHYDNKWTNLSKDVSYLGNNSGTHDVYFSKVGYSFVYQDDEFYSLFDVLDEEYEKSE